MDESIYNLSSAELFESQQCALEDHEVHEDEWYAPTVCQGMDIDELLVFKREISVSSNKTSMLYELYVFLLSFLYLSMLAEGN